MNGKMIKRIAAGILTTVLVAGTLTACSPAPAQSTASTAGEKTTESGAATTDSGSFIADRTITIQAYVDDIGNSLPKEMNNTEVMKKITELTGIKLNVQYTPGDSDAAVMAAQLASGTIPDMIISYLDNSTRPEFPILLKAAKEGMFANVQDYIKNSKVYSKYMEDNYLPSDTKKNIMFREDLDGVYIVSRGVSAEDTSMIFDPEENYKGGMYIQKAIADSLKIDVKTINTQDQFYDLLKKIKDGGFKDNNGNAVYPLGPKYWGGSYDSIKFACPGLIWGVSDGYNLDKDGNVKHEAEMESIYTEINYVRKLIDEGLMNPEYFTMDATRAKEVSESKNSAIISDVHNYIDLIYKSDEWIPLGPLNDISGNNKTVTSGKSASGCFAISAKAEKPEEIFKFMDWISSKEGQLIAEYGVEGVSYDMVDGNPVLNAEALKAVNDGDIEYMVNKIGASFGGAGSYLFEYLLTDFNNKVNFGEARPGANASSTYTRSVEIAKEYPAEMKLVPGLGASSYMNAEELADVKTQMDLLNWKDVFVQACFAKTDDEVKNIIEAFRAQLKSAGIEKFETYVKGIYDADPTAVSFYK